MCKTAYLAPFWMPQKTLITLASRKGTAGDHVTSKVGNKGPKDLNSYPSTILFVHVLQGPLSM